MTAEEKKAYNFILENDAETEFAISQGYDIRVTEPELLQWMVKYAQHVNATELEINKKLREEIKEFESVPSLAKIQQVLKQQFRFSPEKYEELLIKCCQPSQSDRIEKKE